MRMRRSVQIYALRERAPRKEDSTRFHSSLTRRPVSPEYHQSAL
jgi:hypothetical protein